MKNTSYLCAAIFSTVLFAQCEVVQAQSPSGSAKVNGEVITTVSGGINKGTGLSVAGDKVFTPEKESYKIAPQGVNNLTGQRDPIPEELNILRNVMNAAASLVAITNPTQREAAIKRLNDQFALIKPTPQEMPTAFQETAKRGATPTTFEAKTDPLANPTIAESAFARSKQTLDPSPILTPRSFTSEQELVSEILKLGEKVPAAAAFGIDRDPLAIDWKDDTPQVTVNLSNLSLVAQANQGAVAAAFYGIDTSFVNFNSLGSIPSNLAPLEDQATRLFDFSIALGNDGMTVTPIFAFGLASGAGIIDSAGNDTLEEVVSSLNQVTNVIDGRLSFNPDYSFTIVLPENPKASVLFIRDRFATSATATTATTTPEPSSILGLLVFGTLNAGATLKRKLRRKPEKQKTHL